MRFRTLFLFVILLLSGLFALLNWQAFTTPTTLSLGLGTVQAPLGLVMLGVVLVLGAMCLAFVIYVQGAALMESRRLTKELEAQRQLADKAEASRFTELRTFMMIELQKVTQTADAMHQLLLARLNEIEERSRTALQETGNSLSACIGELEDRLERERADLPIDGTRVAGTTAVRR